MPSSKPADAGLKHGWRSGLEEKNALALRSANCPFKYEALVVPFIQPEKLRKYTVDFTLLNNGIVVETKGRFVSADRQKHLLVQAQYPDLDLRFVFGNPNARIAKKSATTYARWCESNGFLYAKLTVPLAWMQEPPNSKSLAAIARLTKENSRVGVQRNSKRARS